jgi:hypothetical protein
MLFAVLANDFLFLAIGWWWWLLSGGLMEMPLQSHYLAE